MLATGPEVEHEATLIQQELKASVFPALTTDTDNSRENSRAKSGESDSWWRPAVDAHLCHVENARMTTDEVDLRNNREV